MGVSKKREWDPHDANLHREFNVVSISNLQNIAKSCTKQPVTENAYYCFNPLLKQSELFQRLQ